MKKWLKQRCKKLKQDWRKVQAQIGDDELNIAAVREAAILYGQWREARRIFKKIERE